MKTVFNILLVACIVGLVWICFNSIMSPIRFDNEKQLRDKAVIARLLEIRKAQQEYAKLNNQHYTASFDTLITFVKTAKIPFLFKAGELNDKQLEDGLTEKKAMAIINKAKTTGKYDDVKKYGLENFKRDTMWVSVLDTIYPKGFNADSLRFVPYTNGAQFAMGTKNDTLKSGAPVFMYEVKVPYTVYLNGLDKQEIINLVDTQEKLYRYPGLMIGSLESWNSGGGNWE